MVTNGIARLEFLAVKEVNTKTHQASLENVFRISMPVDGIMQAIETLEKMKVDFQATQQTAKQQETEQQKAKRPTEQPQPKRLPPKKAPAPSKPKRKLTKEMFAKLSPEQQAKIRQLAKQKEREKIRQQLSQ